MTSKASLFFHYAILLLISLILALAAGEIFVRIVYRDGGSKTSNGPGSKRFEYLVSEQGKRGPTIENPQKRNGTRILIQGDSITFGAGVRDWRDLYPYRLFEMLKQSGKACEMEVAAEAGWEIDSHRYQMGLQGERLHPDIVVYQWYINDLEIHKEGRLSNDFLFWRNYRFHETMTKHSFLYNFLDKKLADIVPPSNRTYTQYLLEDYAEKTPGWWYFRWEFHNWAILAKAYSHRRILMLYPCLPYRGRYPLQAINDRIAGLAKINRLIFPVVWSDKKIGDEVADQTSYVGTALEVTPEQTPAGVVFRTPPIYLGRGNHQAIFRIKGGRRDNQKGNLILKVVLGERLLVEKILGSDEFARTGFWEEFILPFSLNRTIQDNIRFQAEYFGRGGFRFDCVQLPVDYGLEVLDLLPCLKDVKTHASPFDAHPNPNTHRIMAETLFQYLTQRQTRLCYIPR